MKKSYGFPESSTYNKEESRVSWVSVCSGKLEEEEEIRLLELSSLTFAEIVEEVLEEELAEDEDDDEEEELSATGTSGLSLNQQNYHNSK